MYCSSCFLSLLSVHASLVQLSIRLILKVNPHIFGKGYLFKNNLYAFLNLHIYGMNICISVCGCVWVCVDEFVISIGTLSFKSFSMKLVPQKI